ncbi:MAG: pentapeptide repeat-containing protein [Desulfuromonadaceae bacterium]|nr:pentapeptide repeat-containing protein [Desulfuromonadaceae bacterium]MDD5107002.1 pentapeptide repeat-containing protein [Desulfuromonadaceae bacterium]
MSGIKAIVIVVNVLLVTVLIGTPLFRAHAESSDPKAVYEAVPVYVIEPEEMMSTDTTVTEDAVKNLKKGSSKNTGKVIEEMLPGEKLTIKQVMYILKDTRNFSGKNLSGLKLIGINFGKCNLKGVDLNHANLERADLGESNLERADLTGANMKMSNLRMSGMTAAKLDRAMLDGAIWKDGMVCSSGSVGQCREYAITSSGK